MENVRCGSFSMINLDNESTNMIHKMLSTVNDTCYNCGGDHFISDCNFILDEDGDEQSNVENEDFDWGIFCVRLCTADPSFFSIIFISNNIDINYEYFH